MGKLITETLLWLAAATGLVCMVLVILAYWFNISIVMFRTGSMSPTINGGDVAIVQEVEAAAVEVGDILTVDRGQGQLPVTHRVTDVAEGSSPEERVIRMRGDANTSEDPHPYTITEADRALFAVPGVAQPISQMGNPYVLGSVTLAVSAVVMWAFWPRGPASKAAARKQHTLPPGPEPEGRRPRHAATVTAASALAVLAGGAIIAGQAEPAYAAVEEDGIVTEVTAGEALVLTSEFPHAAARNLVPGQSVVWDVEAAVDNPPARGITLTPGLSAAGEIPLSYSLHACSDPWDSLPGVLASDHAAVGDDCPGEHEPVTEHLELELGADPESFEELPGEEAVQFRLVVTMPEDADDSLQGAQTMVRFHLAAAGEEMTADLPSPLSPSTPAPDPTEDGTPVHPGGDLPQTGFALLPLVLTALVLVLVGLAMRRGGRKEPV